MTEDLTNEVKIQLLGNEIEQHKQARYVLEVRHTVNKKLGNSEELKAIVKGLEITQMTINELEKIKKELS